MKRVAVLHLGHGASSASIALLFHRCRAGKASLRTYTGRRRTDAPKRKTSTRSRCWRETQLLPGRLRSRRMLLLIPPGFSGDASVAIRVRVTLSILALGSCCQELPAGRAVEKLLQMAGVHTWFSKRETALCRRAETAYTVALPAHRNRLACLIPVA